MKSKQENPLVSVVIPAYNQADLLQLTIESVLNQTYPNIEIIVVNDGSKDHTADVLKKYEDRIIGINQENQGGNRAQFTGGNAANGTYITFIDHDDLMLPTKIEKQVTLLEKDPRFNVVHCGYYRIDIDGNILDKVTFLPSGDILKDLVSGNFIWSGAPLMRRAQVKDNLFLLESDVWTGDTDFWMRLASTGNLFACIQEPLGKKRILDGTMMANIAKLEKGSFDVLDRNYSNPQLPDDVKALKNQAYGNTYFWLSCRYYQAEQWNDAQRTFLKAVTFHPVLIDPVKNFFNHIQEEALSAVRLIDPIHFVNNLFDHLPTSYCGLRQDRQQMLSIIHMGLSLRSYAKNNIAEAQQQIQESLKLSRNKAEEAATFAELLSFYAMRLPIDDPIEFSSMVFNNLPPEAKHLKGGQSQVDSNIHITQAFLDYSVNEYQAVVQNVLKGVTKVPAWLINRGVVSILMKSVVASLKPSAD